MRSIACNQPAPFALCFGPLLSLLLLLLITGWGCGKSSPTPESLLQKGSQQVEQKDLEGAIATFTEILNLLPENSAAKSDQGEDLRKVALIFRANTRSEQKKYTEAISDHSKALERSNQESTLYLLRAMARSSAKDLTGAIEDTTRAIELSPNDSDSYLLRAKLRKESGDLKGSQTDQLKGIELAPIKALNPAVQKLR